MTREERLAHLRAQLEYWERTAWLDRQHLNEKRPRGGGYMGAVGRAQHSGQQVSRLTEELRLLEQDKGGR